MVLRLWMCMSKQINQTTENNRMKKYLVITGGQSFLVEADSINLADSGVIKIIKGSEIIAALPHGASVIEEDTIIKPETPTIVKPMHGTR